MKTDIKSILKYLLLLAVAGTLLWLAFRGQDLQKIADDLRSADYKWVLLSVLVSIIAHYIRAIRWRMLILPLKHNPSVTNTFHAVMVGYLANLALPRMGEISRCGVLNRTDKIPMNSLIGTVIIERIIDVLFLFIVLFFAVVIEYSIIKDFLYSNIITPLEQKLNSSSALLIILGVLAIIAFILIYLIRKNHEKLLKIKLYSKVVDMVKGFKDGFLSFLKMENKALFIVYSLLIWVGYAVSTYLCYFAIQSTSGLTLSSAVFVTAVGAFGMSAPVQGGIGAYEAAIQLALLVYGIQAVDGLSYATLNHSSQIISILVLGSISLLYIFIINRKSAKENVDHR